MHCSPQELRPGQFLEVRKVLIILLTGNKSDPSDLTDLYRGLPRPGILDIYRSARLYVSRRSDILES